MIRSSLILISLSLVAATATHLWHPAAPVWYVTQIEAGQDEVTMADVASRWNNDVIWVDARTMERHEAGHIPGSIVINEQNRDEALFTNLDKLQLARKPIVVYCDSLKCKASHEIRDYLGVSAALPEVWVLTGGWPAWQAAQK